jgi:hypothetical protein
LVFARQALRFIKAPSGNLNAPLYGLTFCRFLLSSVELNLLSGGSTKTCGTAGTVNANGRGHYFWTMTDKDKTLILEFWKLQLTPEEFATQYSATVNSMSVRQTFFCQSFVYRQANI